MYLMLFWFGGAKIQIFEYILRGARNIFKGFNFVKARSFTFAHFDTPNIFRYFAIYSIVLGNFKNFLKLN